MLDTTATFRLFLRTLTGPQLSAVLDVLGSHVENVEVDVLDDEDPPVEHGFIVELKDLAAAQIAGVA